MENKSARNQNKTFKEIVRIGNIKAANIRKNHSGLKAGALLATSKNGKNRTEKQIKHSK